MVSGGKGSGRSGSGRIVREKSNFFENKFSPLGESINKGVSRD